MWVEASRETEGAPHGPADGAIGGVRAGPLLRGPAAGGGRTDQAPDSGYRGVRPGCRALEGARRRLHPGHGDGGRTADLARDGDVTIIGTNWLRVLQIGLIS